MKFTWIILCGCFIIGLMTDQAGNPGLKNQVPVPCAELLTWRIGDIDPRFNINSETVKELMASVDSLWSAAAGRNVLAYSDSGKIAVNFIYSKSQKETDSEQELSQRINQLKVRHRSVEKEYETLFYHHKKVTDDYDRKFNDYVEEVERYNWMVRRGNGDGVMQDLEQQRLQKIKEKIKEREKKLREVEDELNSMVKALARLSSQLDMVADRVNRLIYSYNDQFSSWRNFYQGVYINDLNHEKINIYEFASLDKLRLVLAHEVGHALGLKHLNNPPSVMYFRMEYQNEQNLKLSQEDIKAIKKQCRP